MRFFVTPINNPTPVVNGTPDFADWAGLGKVVDAADAPSAVTAYALLHGPLAAGRAVRVIEADLITYFPVTTAPSVGTALTYTPPAVSP